MILIQQNSKEFEIENESNRDRLIEDLQAQVSQLSQELSVQQHEALKLKQRIKESESEVSLKQAMNDKLQGQIEKLLVQIKEATVSTRGMALKEQEREYYKVHRDKLQKEINESLLTVQGIKTQEVDHVKHQLFQMIYYKNNQIGELKKQLEEAAGAQPAAKKSHGSELLNSGDKPEPSSLEGPSEPPLHIQF